MGLLITPAKLLRHIFKQQFAIINQEDNEKSLVLITDSLATKKNVCSATRKKKEEKNEMLETISSAG